MASDRYGGEDFGFYRLSEEMNTIALLFALDFSSFCRFLRPAQFRIKCLVYAPSPSAKHDMFDSVGSNFLYSNMNEILLFVGHGDSADIAYELSWLHTWTVAHTTSGIGIPHLNRTTESFDLYLLARRT